MSADPLDDASQHEQEMRDDGIAEITDMAELMPQSEGA